MYIAPEDYENARRNGITSNVLEQRVYTHGWDVDKATTVPLNFKKTFQPIWAKWESIATENGISKNTFYRRVKKGGWTEERAATETPTKSGPRSKFFTPKEMKTLKRNGISPEVARSRIVQLGWRRDEAITVPVAGHGKRPRRKLDVNHS